METKLVPRRWEVSPWSIEPLENRIRRLFDVGFPSLALEEGVGLLPPTELTEKDEHFVLTMELPGVKREDVSIELQDNVLTITGEKKDFAEEKNGRRHMWERSYGSFTRTLSLPAKVDAKTIKAEFKDGVLTVTLPKSQEAKGRRIEIG